MTLTLIAIGGLGNMLGPSAKHLKNSDVAKFKRILDRKKISEQKEKFRQAWIEHGAQLVSSTDALVGDGDFDGVVICAGKNGDDYQILCELIPLLQLRNAGRRYFILHLSTVSCDFVKASYQYCAEHGINYVNYPLTGGAKGAEAGTMLILASGDKKLYARVEPLLQAVGKPNYFGENCESSAAVKLIGHVMVFHGLLGISLAINLHKQVNHLSSLDKEQANFFDFLNQGAGGTKQWDFPVRLGIVDNNWNYGFLLRHAVVDIIYTVDLMKNQDLPEALMFPLLEIALLFSYLLNNHPEKELATQAITDLIANTPSEIIDAYIKQSFSCDLAIYLDNCIAALPDDIQQTVMLDVHYPESKV